MKEKKMQFLAIAMKYIPEAQAKFGKSGKKISIDQLQPYMELYTKVMNEAYQLGYKDGKSQK